MLKTITMSLVYWFLGKQAKRKNKQHVFRKALSSVRGVEQGLSRLSLSQLTIEENVNQKKLSEQYDMARDTARRYFILRDDESFTLLKDIYNRVLELLQEKKTLQQMKKVLLCEETMQNKLLLNRMCQNQILAEHKISKINRHVCPSSRKLAKISSKLQVEKDMIKSTKEDLEELIEKSEDEEDDEEKQNQSFINWLECLLINRDDGLPITKPMTTEELEARLEKLKER